MKQRKRSQSKKTFGESESETPFWGTTTSGLSDEGSNKVKPSAQQAKGNDANSSPQKGGDDEYLGVAPVPRFDKNALPPAKKAQWSDLATRAGWSFIMVGAFSAIIYGGHVLVLGLVFLLQSALYSEISNLRKDPEKEKKLPYLKFVRWYFFATMLLYGHGRSLKNQICQLELLLTSTGRGGSEPNAHDCFMNSHEFMCFIFYCLGIVLFVLTLRKGYFRYQFGNFAWTHMTLLLVILQTSWLSANIFSGLIWFVLPAFLVICNDTSAYFCGRAFGRTPLIAISPKKTWEGFIGATLCTILFAFLLSDVLSRYQHMVCPKETIDILAVSCEPSELFLPTPYRINSHITTALPFLPQFVVLRPVQLHAMVLALFASSIGPFGGFFASGIKRALKKKDFGDIIPGHGGVTDRFDCQILMAAFVFFYHRTFLYTRPVSVAQVMGLIRLLSPTNQQIVLSQLTDMLQSA